MCTLLDLSKENLNDLIENGKVLTAWRQASECLEYFKAIEMKLRKEQDEYNDNDLDIPLKSNCVRNGIEKGSKIQIIFQ